MSDVMAGGIVRQTNYHVEIRVPRAGLLPAVKWLRRRKMRVPAWMMRLERVDDFHNLVVNAGLDDSLDKHLKGSSYTAAWYMGLADGTPSFAAADTNAGHAGWAEVTAYDEAARQTVTFGAVSSQSVNNSGSPCVFTVSSDLTTIGGAFLSTTNTKGGSVDTLYGGGAFSSGDVVLNDGSTITVTVTCTAAAT